MLSPLIALIAHLLIALGSTSFVVAWPDETFEQAETVRACVHLTVDPTGPVVCTDGRTAGRW